MKKILFSLMFAGISAVTVNAQKIWNFNDPVAWPIGGVTYDTDYDGLKFIAGSSSTIVISAQGASFPDGSTTTQRLAFGGNSYSGSTNPVITQTGAAALPTRRYLELTVSGDTDIKIWSKGGGNGRSIVVADKAASVILFKGDFTAADAQIFTYAYKGAAGTLIIATAGGDNSIQRLQTSSPTLAVYDAKSGVKANAFSSGSKIYVSNLQSKSTAINVYSANGSLVKSLKSSTDTNFEINSKGIFIVNLKSEAGEKSVKVLVK